MTPQSLSSTSPSSPSRAVRALQWTNHVLITFFAISSGLFKLAQGEADVKLYAVAGIGVGAMMAIGAVQAAGGVALVFARTRTAGAVVVTAINLLASVILFINGIQPFGAISLLFVAMAALELRFKPKA
jgi:hypothetical protein